MEFEQSGIGQERRRGCRGLTIVLLLLVVALVGAVAARLAMGGTGLDLGLLDLGLRYSLRHVRGRAFPMPATGDVRSPDLLITSWVPSSESDALFVSYTAKTGKRRKVLWEKKLPESDDWYYPLATFDEERVYYVAQDRLMAWDRTDGADAWEALLSDVVDDQCLGCIQRVKDNVIVVSEDYVLQSIDAESGQEKWTVRLNERMAAGSGFLVVNDQIVLWDDTTPDGSDSALHYYDPDDGRLVRQVAPTCPDADDDPRIDGGGVFYENGSPSPGRVYLHYTCGWDPYIEAWRLGSAELLWKAALPKELDRFDGAMLGEEALYVTTYEGLWMVSLDDGQAAFLTDKVDPDYDVWPFAQQGDTILARAKRTRGSTRYELWGLEPSGERVWRHQMEADTLYRAEAGIEDWGFRFVADGVLVAQILGDPDRLLVETLDVETGQVKQESSVGVANDSLDEIVWDNQFGFITVWGDVYAVDLESGTVEPEWP